MGGTNEFKVNKTSTSEENVIGNIRIHENSGEIHFHDDARQLKVAVPVADLYNGWQKLSSGQKKRLKFKDCKNGTKVKISITNVSRTNKNPIADINVEVSKLKLSTTSVLPKSRTTELASFAKFFEDV